MKKLVTLLTIQLLLVGSLFDTTLASTNHQAIQEQQDSMQDDELDNHEAETLVDTIENTGWSNRTLALTGLAAAGVATTGAMLAYKKYQEGKASYALFDAIKTSEIEDVKDIVTRNPNLLSKYVSSTGNTFLGNTFLGNTFLNYAILKENPDIIEFLIDKCVPIHQMDDLEMEYIFQDENINLVTKLLEYNQNIVNIQTKITKESPLMVAVMYNAENTVQLLLGKGADVNLVDNYGNTALKLGAIYEASAEIQNMLKAAVDASSAR